MMSLQDGVGVKRPLGKSGGEGGGIKRSLQNSSKVEADMCLDISCRFFYFLSEEDDPFYALIGPTNVHGHAYSFTYHTFI